MRHEIYNYNLDVLSEIFHKYNQEDKVNTDKLAESISYEKVHNILMTDSIPAVCKNVGVLRKACVLSKQTVIEDFRAGGDFLQYQFFNFSELSAAVSIVLLSVRRSLTSFKSSVTLS